VAAEGRVELRLQVDEQGVVTVLEAVYRPLPGGRATSADGQKVLTKAASAGVKKWRYRPGRRNGEPARMEVRTMIDFSLVQ
jgi:TonB family protein